MSFGVLHDHYDAIVIVMPFAGGAAAQVGRGRDRRRNVIDSDIEMDSRLADLRLVNALEDQSWEGIVSFTQIDPGRVRRATVTAK